jgi:hypothetical protein
MTYRYAFNHAIRGNRHAAVPHTKAMKISATKTFTFTIMDTEFSEGIPARDHAPAGFVTPDRASRPREPAVFGPPCQLEPNPKAPPVRERSRGSRSS